MRVLVDELATAQEPTQHDRLATTRLDPHQFPAEELVALYHGRCEAEGTPKKIPTNLAGPRLVTCSKNPDLDRQELKG